MMTTARDGNGGSLRGQHLLAKTCEVDAARERFGDSERASLWKRPLRGSAVTFGVGAEPTFGFVIVYDLYDHGYTFR
jgi:hypothetical protein